VKHGGTLKVRSTKGHGSTFIMTLPYRMRSASNEIIEGEGAELELMEQPERAASDPEREIAEPPRSMRSFTEPPIQEGQESTSQSMVEIASRASSGRRSSISSLRNSRLSDRQPKRRGQGLTEASPTRVILYVDDDNVSQQVMASLFHGTEYQLQAAYSGGDAMNYLNQNPAPSVILLEMMLPGISGLDVLRSVRKTHPPEAVPVIMMSATNSQSAAGRCLKMGANDFVQKPFGKEEMVSRVERLCNRTSARWPRNDPGDLAEMPSVESRSTVNVDLMQDLIPDQLLEELVEASRLSSEPLIEAVRSRLRRFLSSAESGPGLEKLQEDQKKAEISLRYLQSRLEEAEQEAALAKETVKVGQEQLEKLHAWQETLRSTQLQRLDEEVKRREQQLLHYQHWQTLHRQLPQSCCTNGEILKKIRHCEESLALDELKANRIIDSLPEADATVLRSTVLGMKDRELRLLQESSCKDQLLLDANFKLHILGQTLAQKDIQLDLGRPALPAAVPGAELK